jgi:hypothetical protein
MTAIGGLLALPSAYIFFHCWQTSNGEVERATERAGTPAYEYVKPEPGLLMSMTHNAVAARLSQGRGFIPDKAREVVMPKIWATRIDMG